MNFIAQSDRQQIRFLPPAIEDYVGADNPVRFLDAFVDKLDLKDAGFLFPKDNALGAGRPAYHPSALLKLYIYGYLNQIRSSRRLEAECQRNVELFWLMRELRPDFKTIADFRKDNASAFKNALREFTRLCRQLDLFGGQLLAIDGSKFKASNAPHLNWSQGLLDKQLAAVDARVEEYVKALAEADAQTPAPMASPGAAQLKEKIARLEEKKKQIQERVRTLVQSGQTQISGTDPDSRCMKSRGRMVIGYNVQASVDAKHHLLVTTEVTNTAADQGQLAAVAQAAKDELKIQQADVVADSGYYKGEDIRKCQEMGFEAHLPAPKNSPSERAGLYGKSDFSYDAPSDTYHCPGGAQLTRQSQKMDKGRLIALYENRKACRTCACKVNCTQSPHRTVSRWEHEESLERMEKAKASAPEKLAARQSLIEHCWASLKWLLPGGFLVRGKVKVGAEVSLAHWAYNFRRALAVLGTKKLLESLSQFKAGQYKMARVSAGGKTAQDQAHPSPSLGRSGSLPTFLAKIWRRCAPSLANPLPQAAGGFL
jgi:transposase